MNLSNCESVKGAFFKIMGFAGKHFLFSPPLPSPLLPSVLRSPQFLRSQKAKNASNRRKALRKRLLRRLRTKLLKFFSSELWPIVRRNDFWKTVPAEDVTQCCYGCSSCCTVHFDHLQEFAIGIKNNKVSAIRDWSSKVHMNARPWCS